MVKTRRFEVRLTDEEYHRLLFLQSMTLSGTKTEFVVNQINKEYEEKVIGLYERRISSVGE